MVPAAGGLLKTLLVLRHAHARRSSESGADFDRPLDERGERDAARVGELLATEGLVPDRVLTSSAVRAASTAHLAAEAAGLGADIVEELDALYETDAGGWAVALVLRGGDAERVLAVGHNPTLEELVELLTEREVRLKTGELARIDLESVSWEQLERGTGRLVERWRPDDPE